MKRIFLLFILLVIGLACFASADDQPSLGLQTLLKNSPKARPADGTFHIIGMQGNGIRQLSYSSVRPPIATTTTPGTVKVGSGLAITPDGTLNNTGIAGVASFNGRGGPVQPQAGDYSITQISGAAAVAASNSYLDLRDRPTIPPAQVPADWNQTTITAPDYIKGKPTIPSQLSQLAGDSTHRTVTDAEKAGWNSNSSPVQSVFGRTGAVVRQAGDYTAVDVGADPLGSATSVQSNLDLHKGLINNPHQVTKAQVGLGSVPDVDATNPANITQDATHRFATDAEKSAWNAKQTALGFTPENAANKAVANGYASLDAAGKIPAAQVPAPAAIGALAATAQAADSAKLGGTAAATVVSGASAGATALQPTGNGSQLTGITPTQIGAATAAQGTKADKAVLYATTATELTAQLAAAGTAGGGTVYLPAGTFIGTWGIPANVSLIGAGKGATILKLPNNSANNTGVLWLGDYSMVSNLTVDGNIVNQITGNINNGIGVSGAGWAIDNCEIRYCNGVGIGTSSASNYKITNNHVHHNRAKGDLVGGVAATAGSVGIQIYSGMNPAHADYGTISGNLVTYNGMDGIWLNGSYMTVTGNHSNYNGRGMTQTGAAGIYVREVNGTHDITLTGNHCSFNTGVGIDIPAPAAAVTITGNITNGNGSGGIGAFGLVGGTVSGNISYNNGSNAVGQPTWQLGGIVIYGATGTTVTGNTAYDNQTTKTQPYGLNFKGAVTDCTVANNTAYGNLTQDIHYESDYVGTRVKLDLTASGDTSKVASTTGTLTTDHAAKWDASGNIVDAGVKLAAAKTCTGTDKVSAFDASTGLFTCSADQTATASNPLVVREEDGTPSGTPSTLKVTNGALTDNGDGSFSLNVSGSTMVYPGAGVPNSTGTAWGTSYAVGTAANNLVQMTAAPAKLPSVDGSNLTNVNAATVAGYNVNQNLRTSDAPTFANVNTGSGGSIISTATGGNSSFKFADETQAIGKIRKSSPADTSATYLDFSAYSGNNTGSATYRFGRDSTVGSGQSHAVQVLLGNNSSTPNAQIGGNNADTYFAANNGKVGIGTSTPATGFMLDVNGSIKTNESTLETPYSNGTCTTSINLNAKYGIQTLTLSGACAIGVTNLAAGRSFTVKLTQSSTTVPTFTSAYKWQGGVQPSWSTSATKYDVLSCYSDDGTTLLCNGLVDVR